jgi:toxin YoeB
VGRRVSFEANAWGDYLYWQVHDRQMLARINELIRALLRDPFGGNGKPEPLKRQLSGCWSRRIDQTHRLIYRVDAYEIEIVACRYHYGDR